MHVVNAVESGGYWLYRKVPSGHWLHRWSDKVTDSLEDYSSLHDEKEFVLNDTSDLQILAEVDSVQSNDDLIGTVIFESLRQIQEPEWEDIVKFLFRLIEPRVQQTKLLSEPWYSVELELLTRPAYTGIINILCHHLQVQLSKSEDHQRMMQHVNPHALYLLFSDSRHQFPQSGVKLLEEHGTDIVCTLVKSCKGFENRHQAYYWLFARISGKAKNCSWTWRLCLQYFEIIAESIFRSSGETCPLEPFSLQRDITSWPWSAWNDDYNRGPYLCDSAMKLLSHSIIALLEETESTTSNHNTTSALALPSITNQEDRNFCIVGALVSMWNLANIVKYYYGLESLTSVIKSCLSQQGGTLAILQVLGQVPELTFINVCTSGRYAISKGI